MGGRTTYAGAPREKAEHGMALPYDAETVGQLRQMLRAARKRKLSDGLPRRRQER
jgi:hypothetical protein